MIPIQLTQNEQKLINYAKEAIIKHNTKRKSRGDYDTLYSFLITDKGALYEGACFEANISHAGVCGERHAIMNMVFSEGYGAKIQSIVVADPVPSVQEHGTFPCGKCRHLIWSFGVSDTTVILLQYIQEEDGWIFPKMEKISIKDLYPHPYEQKEGLWD